MGMVSLNLPSNVTFTSASGVFGTPSAVPEPASWVLMLTAVILVVGITLKRRWTRSAGSVSQPSMEELV
jgi:hypothetical protein